MWMSKKVIYPKVSKKHLFYQVEDNIKWKLYSQGAHNLVDYISYIYILHNKICTD